MRLLALLCLAAAYHELQDLDKSIAATSSHLDSIRRARDYLLTRTATSTLNPLPVPLVEEDSSWRMHRLIHKWDIVSAK
jgi:hypothetical protein